MSCRLWCSRGWRKGKRGGREGEPSTNSCVVILSLWPTQPRIAERMPDMPLENLRIRQKRSLHSQTVTIHKFDRATCTPNASSQGSQGLASITLPKDAQNLALVGAQRPDLWAGDQKRKQRGGTAACSPEIACVKRTSSQTDRGEPPHISSTPPDVCSSHISIKRLRTCVDICAGGLPPRQR